MIVPLYIIADTSEFYFEIALYHKRNVIKKASMYNYDLLNKYLAYSHVDLLDDWAGLELQDTVDIVCPYYKNDEIVDSVIWKARMIFSPDKKQLNWVFYDKINKAKSYPGINFMLPDSCLMHKSDF